MKTDFIPKVSFKADSVPPFSHIVYILRSRWPLASSRYEAFLHMSALLRINMWLPQHNKGALFHNSESDAQNIDCGSGIGLS